MNTVKKDPLESITVLGEYVLVKQVMKKKEGRIIKIAAKDQKDQFDFYSVVVQKGDECKKEKLKIGDSPILGQYANPSAIKVLDKNDNGVISLVIYHESDIVGIDNEPSPLEIIFPN